ncbi:putative disease resistance protein [Gossypium australe]|uniref:Putative disease resistance protein n=1 Tax=Gossypium australe TaxID=47621 RepID=A0A5B6VTY4_9ROSI|nr:putative disease resistance protein [Gossypium australe]
MPKQEVERWFKKVEEKLANAQNVEDKISKGKSLFGSSLGKLVDETTHALKEVQAEGNFSGSLVVNDLSIVAVKLPTQNLVGHQVSVRDEIYGLIREAKFKKLIWITVSRNLDIRSIQKDIVSQLKKALPDHENTTVRARKLSEILREQGQYTLILDDVWSSFPLEDIGINELTKENGCILLTTHSEEVIQSMGCKKVQGISNPRVWKNVVNELRGYIRNIQDMEDKVVENSAYVKMHDVFRDMVLHIKRKRFMVKAGKQLKELPNEEEWDEDLEKVSLMYNSISAIPQHMKCPKFPKLTTLLLSRNSLREIPESFFERFPNLKILDLSHNPFESLPSSISALEKLTALLLNGCHNLESLPSVLKLKALKKLRLRGSGMKEIP